jgi:glycosyltransferase involved in cell wall biosynthesis
MKKAVSFLLSLFLFFIIGFTIAKTYPPLASFLKKNEKQHAQFTPTAYPLKNHPFAIAIIGRNNGAFARKTIHSVLSQNYDNFRVIYVDDASTDGSFHEAREAIYDSEQSSKVLLVQNEKPLGAIFNLLRVAQSCSDEEILVLVNGEDLLAHEWVLQKLNQYYANPDLWMTYGKYLEFPTFAPGSCLPGYDEKTMRKTPFPSFHLKTFYASLFKKIQESDLIYHGEFMPDSADFSYIIPLLEMAQGHVQYLNEVLYLVTQHPKKDEKLHELLEISMREKTPYQPIHFLEEKREL